MSMRAGAVRGAAAVAGLILFSAMAGPAVAGQAELDLLRSYTGNWSGAGLLVGGERPQPFRCRMTIAKSTQVKINYSGRCTLVNMNLSVADTIAFNDATGRYEAAMSSNAGFTGYAVGTRHDDQIDFTLAQTSSDRRGSKVRIGARIHLVGGAVAIDYQVEFNNSGNVMRAVVPFRRDTAS